MSRLHRIARLTAVLLLAAAPLYAGAWTQARGEGYYEVTGRMSRGDDYRDGAGTKTLIPTLSEYTMSAYGEYGWRDGITLVAYIPVLKRVTLNEQIGRESRFVYFGGDAVTGIADAEVGVRCRLVQRGPHVVSAGLTLGLPLGDDGQPNGLLTGDGEFNQRVALLYGLSLYPWPAYVGAELAYDLRHGGYADDLSLVAEAGVGARRARLTLRLHALRARGNGDAAVSGGTGGLYGNGRRFVSFGPKLSVRITPRVELSVAVVTATAIRNAIAAPDLSISLSTKR